ELDGQGRQGVDHAVGEAVFDGEIPSFDPAMLGQGAEERLTAGALGGLAGRRQGTNAVDLRPWLGRRGPRRPGSCAAGGGGRAPRKAGTSQGEEGEPRPAVGRLHKGLPASGPSSGSGATRA